MFQDEKINKSFLDNLTIKTFIDWYNQDKFITSFKGRSRHHLNTRGHSLEEVKLLRMWLFKNLGISSTPLRQWIQKPKKFYWVLYIAKDSVAQLNKYLKTFSETSNTDTL